VVDQGGGGPRRWWTKARGSGCYGAAPSVLALLSTQVQQHSFIRLGCSWANIEQVDAGI
jgi:hypothetical protein